MILLKKFEEYLEDGTVRKQSPDIDRAKSLRNEAVIKKEFMEKILREIKFEEISPNFIIESCYDVIIEFLRAKLFILGYNSNYSHESEVAFMRNLRFEDSDIEFMNDLRYFRNGIKYYGRVFNHEYAEKVLNFLKRIYSRIEKI